MIVGRTEVRVGTLKNNVIHLKQKDIGIIVREEKGHFFLIDANDSSEMFLISSLFKHMYMTLMM